MYCVKNFPSKKALKDAVAAGESHRIYQPGGMFDPPQAAPDYTGSATLEGPHYPKPHTWYAEVQLVNGVITKVK